MVLIDAQIAKGLLRRHKIAATKTLRQFEKCCDISLSIATIRGRIVGYDRAWMVIDQMERDAKEEDRDKN